MKTVWDPKTEPAPLVSIKDKSPFDWTDGLARFRWIAAGLAQKLKQFETVLELALVGSVAGNDPYPRDLDLALALSDMSDINEIARCARQTGADHPAWDIFVFDRDLSHLGRLCHFNECPKGKDECKTDGCGRIPFIKKMPDFDFDERKFFSSPIEVTLSPLGSGLFLERQRALDIVRVREYPPWQPITLTCYICGEDFVLDGKSRKYFDTNRRRYPNKCDDCEIRAMEEQLE